MTLFRLDDASQHVCLSAVAFDPANSMAASARLKLSSLSHRKTTPKGVATDWPGFGTSKDCRRRVSNIGVVKLDNYVYILRRSALHGVNQCTQLRKLRRLRHPFRRAEGARRGLVPTVRGLPATAMSLARVGGVLALLVPSAG